MGPDQILQIGILNGLGTGTGLVQIITGLSAVVQIIGIPVEVSTVTVTGIAGFISTPVRCIQAVVVTNEVGEELIQVQNDSAVGAGEILVPAAIGGQTHGVAVGEYGPLHDLVIAGAVVLRGFVTVGGGFVNAHEAHEAAGTSCDSACGGGSNITGGEAVGIAGTMAGTDKTTGAPALSAVVGQLNTGTEQLTTVTADALNGSRGNVAVISNDIAAGVAAVEVGQLRVADEGTDTVGVTVVLGCTGAHVAGYGNGSKAVGEGQHVLAGQQLAVILRTVLNGTVGLGIAHQTADSTFAADTVPGLGDVCVVSLVAQILANIAGGILVHIDTAVGDDGIVTRCTHQSAGGRVALAHNGTALDNRVNNIQSVDGGIHIAEQAGEVVVNFLMLTGGVELTAGRHSVQGRVDIQVIHLMACALDGGMGIALDCIQLVGQSRYFIIEETAVQNFADFLDCLQQLLKPAAHTVVIVTGINEGGGTEQGSIVNRHKVRQRSCRSFIISIARDHIVAVPDGCTGVVGFASLILIIIISNGGIPVDVLGEHHIDHLVCQSGGNGIQVLQVTSVGHTQVIADTRAGSLHERKHGIDVCNNTGGNLHQYIADIHIHSNIRLNGDVFTGQDLEAGFIRQRGHRGLVAALLGSGSMVCKAAVLHQRVNGEFHHNGIAAFNITIGAEAGAGILNGNFHRLGTFGHTEFTGDRQNDVQSLGKLIQAAVEVSRHGDPDLHNTFFTVNIFHGSRSFLPVQLGAVQTGTVVITEHPVLTGILIAGKAASGRIGILCGNILIILFAVENCENIAREGVVFDDDLPAHGFRFHTAGGKHQIKGISSLDSVNILAFESLQIRVNGRIRNDSGTVCIPQPAQFTVASHICQVLLGSHEDALGIVIDTLELQRPADGKDGRNRNGDQDGYDGNHHQKLRQGIAKGTLLCFCEFFDQTFPHNRFCPFIFIGIGAFLCQTIESHIYR